MSAGDQAAVIDSRIHDINKLIGPGPLPWLPGIPHRIANHPNWGPYLIARSHLVTQLADQVRSNAEGDTPAWAAVARSVPAELIADAACEPPPRSTPPTCDPPGHPTRQRCSRLATATRQATRRRDTHADLRWRRLLATEDPQRDRGPIPAGTRRLHNLTRAGFDATLLVRSAAAAAPPDDHPAAALWWRILDQIPQTPNQEHATPAPPATRRTATTSHDQQRPVRAPRRLPPRPEPLTSA